MATSISIIILAAGASERMGRPKQLLPFRGRSLLRHAVETAVATECRPVVVVLGAGAETASLELGDSPVHPIVNPDWQVGMGSSIAAGVREVARVQPDASGVMVMLCDQPFVTPQLLEQLVVAHRRGGWERCACAYGGKLGVPALFAASWFARLTALRGEGASRLLNESAGSVFAVPFPAAEIDVDTPAEYERLDERSDGE